MSIEVADLRTKFSGDTRDLERAFASAERRTNQFVANTNKSFSTMGSVAQGALSVFTGNLLTSALSKVAGGFTDVINSGLEFNSLMERARIGMKVFTGSAEETEKHLQALVKFAIPTPFSAQGLVEMSQRLQAIGFNAKDVIPILTAVGDAVAGLGGDTDQLERIVRAISDIKVKGKVQAEEIRQLANASIPAWEMLAKAAGTSTRKIQELAEAGKLDANKAIEVLLSGMEERYPEMMKKVKGTTLNLMETFQDLLQQRAATAFKPLSELRKQALKVGIAGLESDVAGNFAGGAANIINMVTGPVGAAMNMLASGDIGGMMAQVGEKISGGLNTAVDFAKEQGKQIGTNLKEGTEEALEMKSPSRAYYRIGLMAAAGFHLGFNAGMQQGGDDSSVEALLQDPRVKALLDVIKRAEGGGIRTLVGGAEWQGGLDEFPPWSGKPFRDPKTGKAYTSHAAGLYQFQPGTYEGIGREFGLPSDFNEHTQDLHAVALLKKLGAIDALFSGGFGPDLIGKLGSQWASIPGPLPGGTKFNPKTLAKMYAQSLGSPLFDSGGLTSEGQSELDGLRAAIENLQKSVDSLQYPAGTKMTAVTEKGDIVGGASSKGGFLTAEGQRIVQIPTESVGRGSMQWAITAALDQQKAEAEMLELRRRVDELEAKADAPPTPLGSVSAFDPTALPEFRGMPSFMPSSLPSPDKLFPGGAEIRAAVWADMVLDFQKLNDEIAGTDDGIAKFGQLARDAKGRVKGLVVEGQSLREMLDEAAARVPNLKEQFKGFTAELPDEMGNVFGDAIRNWDGSFQQLWQSIGLGFSQMLSNMAAQLASSAISKLLTALIGAVVGGIGGGGGWTSASSLPGGSVGNYVFGGGAYGGAFAEGGYLAPGKWGVAGERGPEPIFGGPTGLTVVPNKTMSSGGTTINYNTFNFQGRPSKSGHLHPKDKYDIFDTIKKAIR